MTFRAKLVDVARTRRVTQAIGTVCAVQQLGSLEAASTQPRVALRADHEGSASDTNLCTEYVACSWWPCTVPCVVPVPVTSPMVEWPVPVPQQLVAQEAPEWGAACG